MHVEIWSDGEAAAAVRAGEEWARMFGITGVPFFAIDERYGVSGAQQPAAILAVLEQAASGRPQAPAQPRQQPGRTPPP